LLVLAVATAALVSACMGESASGGEEGTVETAPATSVEAPEIVQPPGNFSARPSAFTISLSWSGPAGDPEVDVYALYRNGAEVIRLDASDTTYVDDGLTPGRDYRYEIEAHAGELISERVALEATTRVPPLRAARVDGVFNVRTKELSASGYVERSVPIYGWRFRPRCAEGACDVRWSDLQRKRIRSVLERRGTRYGGTYKGLFNVRCGTAQATSVVEIRLKVEAARPIAGEWRATRLTGTLSHSEAAQLGCVSAQTRLSLRARLIR
jgi:hypothetical protein